MEGGTGTEDEFTAMSNRGNVNNNGAANDMDWDKMVQEEVQDHFNDADKSDISKIGIILHY